MVVFNVNGKNYIIDPIKYKLNLNPIYKIFSNEKIIKVIHSARHDLDVLFFDRKEKVFANIIDTQIMANFSNIGNNIGYKTLTKKLCHRKLNGESQRSDWKSRPLTEKQLKYAALDVEYLTKIYNKLHQTLEKSGKLKWFSWSK